MLTPPASPVLTDCDQLVPIPRGVAESPLHVAVLPSGSLRRVQTPPAGQRAHRVRVQQGDRLHGHGVHGVAEGPQEDDVFSRLPPQFDGVQWLDGLCVRSG